MTITAEELKKVYEESFEGAIVAQESQGDAFDAALLAVARYVAEKQRAADRKEMLLDASDSGMQSVAPLVVPEEYAKTYGQDVPTVRGE